MENELLNDSEAAEYLRLQRQTMAAWRCRGRGPSFIRVGRRVYYKKSTLDEWLERQTVVISSQAE
jgi:excisionase family DNA binding protein